MTHLELACICLLGCLPVMAGAQTEKLPDGSRFLDLDGRKVYSRQWGEVREGPSVILLSGPTDHWHSDSGWFALLAPLLAGDYRTITIDRPGGTWSEPVAEPGYSVFGESLGAILEGLDVQDYVLVSFASSNLAVNSFLARQQQRPGLQGIVLIDPDTLIPETVAFYKEFTGPFQDREAVRDYVLAGKYAERARQINDREMSEVRAMVPERYQDRVDWSYLEQVFALRLEPQHIAHRFAEVAGYNRDLDTALQQPLPGNIPLVIIDSDFESRAIALEPDKPELAKWREASATWYQSLVSEADCGHYLPLDSDEHLVMMAEPDVVRKAVSLVLDCGPDRKGR